MQILVTGGAGFIGSVVVRRAVNEGHFVTNYDALTAAASLGDIWDLEEADNYQLVLGDISDRNKLKKLIQVARPQLVFHCAVETLQAWPLGGEERCLSTNVTGTAILLELLQEFWTAHNMRDEARFVQLCAARADLPKDPSYVQDTVLIAQDMVANWGRDTGIPVTQFHAGQIFGPGQRFCNEIERLWQDLDAGQESHGLEAKNWLSVSDLAYSMLAQGIGAGAPSRVNIGTPFWLTDRQMQDLIGQVARGDLSKLAPQTPPHMMTAFDHVLDVPLKDRLSKTLSWLSDRRGLPPVEAGAAHIRVPG
ncbi:MAG: GDP-mannose 4,6-dehydratase [Planktomarina sp.]|nr:GDP-mannose 4,6-dehydratase [Planktomarina sp.]